MEKFHSKAKLCFAKFATQEENYDFHTQKFREVLSKCNSECQVRKSLLDLTSQNANCEKFCKRREEIENPYFRCRQLCPLELVSALLSLNSVVDVAPPGMGTVL